MNFERIVLGLIIAVIVLQVIENAGGEDFAGLYILIIILGFVIYNRVQLSIFGDQLSKRLQGKT